MQILSKELCVNLTRAFSALILFRIALMELKKGKVKLCSLISLYDRFLLSISRIKAPIMIITIIIAATPNSTVPVDARPVGGEAVGAGVAAGELAWTYVPADDGQ
jgi:hypothetical protein